MPDKRSSTSQPSVLGQESPERDPLSLSLAAGLLCSTQPSPTSANACAVCISRPCASSSATLAAATPRRPLRGCAAATRALPSTPDQATRARRPLPLSLRAWHAASAPAGGAAYATQRSGAPANRGGWPGFRNRTILRSPFHHDCTLMEGDRRPNLLSFESDMDHRSSPPL
jgi:hypothetical protein